jgi:hypothetical protein
MTAAIDLASTLLRPASDFHTMEPGVYLDVPFGKYLAAPALSNSFLCGFERSPGYAEWSKDAPIDDEAESATDLGALVHTMVLEPESLPDRYLVMPKLKLTTNEGREKAAEYEAQAKAAGLIPLDAVTMRKARLMAGSMMAHPDMRMWLTAVNGYSEATIIWRDDQTGLLCKARCDRLIFVPGGAVIFDVKTIARIEKLNRWYVQDYCYDRQRAHYVEAAESLKCGNVWFYFGFVSSSLNIKRYPVRYVELSPDLVVSGYEKQRARLAKYKQCLEFNDFTGAEII